MSFFKHRLSDEMRQRYVLVSLDGWMGGWLSSVDFPSASSASSCPPVSPRLPPNCSRRDELFAVSVEDVHAAADQIATGDRGSSIAVLASEQQFPQSPTDWLVHRME